MNKDIINKSMFWQLLYIVIYSFCTVMINIYFPDAILFAVGIAGAVYILFNLFFVKYKRERLFINGIIGAVTVVFLESWIGKQLELESMISIAVAVTAIDIVSISFPSYLISFSFNQSSVTKIRSISISSPCHFHFVLYYLYNFFGLRYYFSRHRADCLNPLYLHLSEFGNTDKRI